MFIIMWINTVEKAYLLIKINNLHKNKIVDNSGMGRGVPGIKNGAPEVE